MLLTNDYYPALSMSNCTVHTSTITKVNDHSISMDNGVTQELDVRDFLKKNLTNTNLLWDCLFGHRYLFWPQVSRCKTSLLHWKLREKIPWIYFAKMETKWTANVLRNSEQWNTEPFHTTRSEYRKQFFLFSFVSQHVTSIFYCRLSVTTQLCSWLNAKWTLWLM